MLFPAIWRDNDNFALRHRLAHKAQAQQVTVVMNIKRQAATLAQARIQKAPLRRVGNFSLWFTHRLLERLHQYRSAAGYREVIILATSLGGPPVPSSVNHNHRWFNNAVEPAGGRLT